MTNQYVLLVVHQKPVAHKAHANAFIFFPVARNFPPLPILAGSPPLLFFFFSPFSFPSPFFYFKFHRSGFNGFLPSPLRFEQRIQARRAPVPLEFQRWWSMHRLIRRPAPPDRGEFLVGTTSSLMSFFLLWCSLMRWYVRKMRNV